MVGLKRISTVLGLLAATAPAAMGQASVNPNQQIADSVAGALKASTTLTTTRIEIEAQNGLVTLSGVTASPEIKTEALERARRVSGVTGVVDKLVVGDRAVRAAQYVPQATREVAMGGHLGRFGHGGVVGGGSIDGGVIDGGMMAGAPMGLNEGQVASGPVFDGGPLPEGPAGGAAPGATTAKPDYAWPSYAPAGNFSAVGYPTAYPWQAWPNIGPFYPYPEVPLDWRAVTLRWDDGIWWLDFKKHYTRPFFLPYPFGIFAY